MPTEPEEKLARALGWGSLALALPQAAAPGTFARAIGVRDDETTRRWIRVVGARELAAAAGILFVEDDRPRATIFARVAGDAKDLTLLGLAWASRVQRPGRLAAFTAAVAGLAAADALAAARLGRPDRKRLAVTVRAPREEVASAWARTGSDLTPALREAPGDRGTELHVEVTGGPLQRSQALNELRRFKQELETSTVARADGSPQGAQTARFVKQRPAQPVEEESS